MSAYVHAGLQNSAHLGVPSASPAGKEWLADQLEILAELHAARVLTDKEFDAAKARLLS